MVHFFLFDYYFFTDQAERARYHFDSALAISHFAEYSFYEAFLYSKGAVLDRAYSARAVEMIRKSGFNRKAACFNVEPEINANVYQ